MAKNNNNSEKKQNNFWFAVKTIFWLTALSFAIAIIISAFADNDFENLDGNVAVIKVVGPIVSMTSGSFFGEDLASADEITKLIRKANKDDSIKAIVLEINSPGGSAVASDEIAIEIKKSNKTTVAWIREVGASGGYWIASSTDHIIANRMTITGSVGVIASYLGFSGLLDDHNITYNRLVSGKYKDLGSPFKELSPDEKRVFQESIDEIHDYFVEEVAANRNLPKRDVEKLATGAFYIGVKAHELGLVDELGSRDELISYLENKIGEEPDFVHFKTKKGFLSSLSGVMNEKFFFIGRGLGSSWQLDEGVKIIT